MAKVEITKEKIIYEAAIFTRNHDGAEEYYDLGELNSKTWYIVSGRISRDGRIQNLGKHVELELKYVSRNIFVSQNNTIYMVSPYMSIDEYINTPEIFIDSISYDGVNKIEIFNRCREIKITNLEQLMWEKLSKMEKVFLHGTNKELEPITILIDPVFADQEDDGSFIRTEYDKVHTKFLLHGDKELVIVFNFYEGENLEYKKEVKLLLVYGTFSHLREMDLMF